MKESFESLDSSISSSTGNERSFFSKFFGYDDSQKNFGPLPDIEYSLEPRYIYDDQQPPPHQITPTYSSSLSSSQTIVFSPSSSSSQSHSSQSNLTNIIPSNSNNNKLGNFGCLIIRVQFVMNVLHYLQHLKEDIIVDYVVKYFVGGKCSQRTLVDNKGDQIRVCNFCYNRYVNDTQHQQVDLIVDNPDHHNIDGNGELLLDTGSNHASNYQSPNSLLFGSNSGGGGVNINSGNSNNSGVGTGGLLENNNNSLGDNNSTGGASNSSGDNSNSNGTGTFNQSGIFGKNKFILNTTSMFQSPFSKKEQRPPTPPPQSILDQDDITSLVFYSDQEVNYDLSEDDTPDNSDDESIPATSVSTTTVGSHQNSYHSISDSSMNNRNNVSMDSVIENNSVGSDRYSMPQKGSKISFSMSSLPSIFKFNNNNNNNSNNNNNNNNNSNTNVTSPILVPSTSPPDSTTILSSSLSKLPPPSLSPPTNTSSMSTSTAILSPRSHYQQSQSTSRLKSSLPLPNPNNNNNNQQQQQQQQQVPNNPTLSSSSAATFLSPFKNRQDHKQIIITPSSLYFSDPSIISLKSHPKTTNKTKFLEKYTLPKKFYESSTNLIASYNDNEKDKISKNPLMEPYIKHITNIITDELQKENIDLSWRQIILDFSKKACEKVKILVKEGDKMSTNEYIKIKKIPGGNRNECSYIDGVVMTKILTHKKMKNKFINPKILLLSCSVEFQRVENKFLFFDQLLQQEKEYLRILVSKIAERKPDLVLVEKTVSRHAQDFLLESGISLALNVKPKVLERLGRCLRGTCGQFRIQTYSEVGLKEEGVLGKKTLMYFEKCPQELGSTITLRGENIETLKKIKKILKNAIYSIHHSYLEVKYLSDLYINNLNNNNNNNSTSTLISTSTSNFLSCSPQVKFPIPKYPSIPWKYQFTSQHIPNKKSLFQSFCLPRTDTGQMQSVIQFYTEDEILGIGTSNAFSNQNTRFPIEKESIYDHQSIVYSHSIFCNANQCIPFEIHSIDYYSDNDLTFGEFLTKFCFNSLICTTKECNRPLLEHERTFLAAGGRINICIQKNVNPNGQQQQQQQQQQQNSKISGINVVNFCKQCAKFSPEKQLSPEAWEMSFGKFLEIMFYGSVPTGIADCNHTMNKDHISYFYYQEYATAISFDPLPRLNLSLPPKSTQAMEPHLKAKLRCREIELLNECTNQVYGAIYEKLMELSEERDRAKELIPSLLDEKLMIITKISDLLGQEIFDKEPIIDLTKTLYANFMTWNSQLSGLANSTNYHRSKRNLTTSYDPDSPNSIDMLKKLNPNQVSASVPKQFLFQQSNSQQNLTIQSPPPTQLNQQSNSQQNLTIQSPTPTTATQPVITINNNSTPVNTSTTNSEIGGDDDIESDDSENLSTVSTTTTTIVPTPNPTPTATVVSISNNNSSNSLSELSSVSPTLTPQLQHQSLRDLSTQTSPSSPHPKDPAKAKPLKIIDTIAGIVSSISSSKMLGSTIPFLLLDADNIAIYENEPSTTIAFTLESSDFKATFNTLLDEELNRQPLFDSPVNSPVPSHQSSQSLSQTTTPQQPAPVIQPPPSDEDNFTEVKDIAQNDGFLRPRSTTESSLKKTIGSNPLRSSFSPTSPSPLHSVSSPEKEIRNPLTTENSDPDLSNFVSNSKSNSSADLNNESESEIVDMYSDENIKLSKLLVSSQRKEIRSRFKFEKNGYELSIFCTTYYPVQFYALREFACGDKQFIESLTRSKTWIAKGGKSGSSWSKTLDDRYILKQVSRIELESFLDFAPLYFEYLCKSYLHEIPTALCKILGVYSIRWKDNNGKSLKKDLIVMENLFYNKTISKTYDLKGSLRSRLVKNESEVLLDENLLQASFSSPICLSEYDKTRLQIAVWNDTAFLSSLNVMDYSMLTGIESNQNQLVVGIIDYMRKFTWDKVIEMRVKQSGIIGGGGKVPTVISPKQYKIRFRDAMWLYFTLVPDKFTKVKHLSLNGDKKKKSDSQTSSPNPQ
eukprot:gene3331-4176_t